MSRVQFVETVTLPLGPGGAIIPVGGVSAIPFTVNPDQTEGPQAPAYANRTGNTLAPSLATASNGTVSYWLESNDYNIHFQDQQNPPRIVAYVRGFNAAVTSQGAIATGDAYAGDYKFSEQINDHGLNPNNSFQWLLVASDAAGLGRQIDHTVYQALWQALGSPAPDGSGLFRIPNVSGRAMMAAGHAVGLNNRALRDILGEENHLTTKSEMPIHSHGGATAGNTTGVDSPDHSHVSYHRDRIDFATGSGTFTAATGWTTPIPLQATTGANVRHAHSIPGLAIGNDGGGAAHNNIQPSYVGNLFIKT